MAIPKLFRFVRLGLCAGLLAGAGAPPVAGAGAPGREQVETMVKSMLSAWESGDAGQFAAGLDERLLFAYPGGRLNRAELLALFKDYHEEKTDVKIYFGRFFADEDEQFALSYQFASTDRKSGKRQAVGTGVIGKIEGGRIVLFKEYYDEHVAVRQAAEEIPLDEGQVYPYPASIPLVPGLIN